MRYFRKIVVLLFLRRIAQFLRPNLSEKFSLLFRRERGDDLFEARIARSFWPAQAATTANQPHGNHGLAVAFGITPIKTRLEWLTQSAEF
jgi:hypothetical protein